ncbi:electron transfer protein 1 [Lactarius hatsudake]|nr:electron transfer protein 1 [Lactarius hatsudake]
MPAALFARTFRLLPKGPVGTAFPCHRGLHRLRFGFPSATHVASSAHASRAATRPYSFVKLSKPWPGATSALEPRFFSSNGTTQLSAAELPVLSPPAVGNWLLLSSALVIAVIVVGGVTRLTESGLSITEWRPITGVLPPLSRAEWESEFDKYKATPEFRLLNSRIALDDFKSIYYMEWGHRVLGRTVGLAFVLPLAYFAARGRLARTLRTPLIGMAVLLGAQGALGWYMVRSGLEEPVAGGGGADNAVPRVSQYRLAAHLGTALALYAGMFAAALSVTADWRFARDGTWGRLRDGRTWDGVLRNPLVRRFKDARRDRHRARAFVAGLDAGLVYNEFPLMGGRLAPPLDELLSPSYADAADGGKGTWRNLFENPTTVQFDHRAALGISTLLYLVPVPLAATHQAGSVALLSVVLHVLLALRRPGAAARAWRQANLAREAAAKAKVTK